MSKKETTVTEVASAAQGNAIAAPLYSNQPAAGFPAPGDDVVEQPLDLNDLLIDNETATFFVRGGGGALTIMIIKIISIKVIFTCGR